VRVEARPQTGEGSVDSIDTIAEAPFYIASTGPRTPRRTLKHDDTFAVFVRQFACNVSFPASAHAMEEAGIGRIRPAHPQPRASRKQGATRGVPQSMPD
jgi:hypothetical protein